METATYIMIQFSLDYRYEKVTKVIIRYVIINLHVGIYLARGICDGKIPNISLYTKHKQDKNMDGTSAFYKEKCEIQVLEWKYTAKIQIKRKRHVNKGSQKLYTILIYQPFTAMQSKLEVTTKHNQV